MGGVGDVIVWLKIFILLLEPALQGWSAEGVLPQKSFRNQDDTHSSLKAENWSLLQYNYVDAKRFLVRTPADLIYSICESVERCDCGCV